MDEQYAPQVGAPQAVLPPDERRNQAMDATSEQPDSTYLSPSDETSLITASSSTALTDAASEIADRSILTALAENPDENPDMPQLDATDTREDEIDRDQRSDLPLTGGFGEQRRQLAPRQLVEQISALRQHTRAQVGAAWHKMQQRVFPPEAFARPTLPPVPSLPPLPDWRMPQVRLPEWPTSEWPAPDSRIPEWRSTEPRPVIWPLQGTPVPASPNATRKLRDPRRHMLLISSLIVLGSMVISLLIPGLAAASAMKDYNDLRAIGESGMRHLLAAAHDLSGLTSLAGKSGSSTATVAVSSSCSTTSASSGAAAASASGSASATSGGKTSSALDPAAFKAADAELKAAAQDFQVLRTRLNRPDWVLATAASIPGLDSTMRSIQALADVGYDASAIGVEFMDAALPMITRLHGASSLTGDSELLMPDDLTRVQTAATHAQDKLTDIQAKLSSVNLSDLPICAKQKQEIAQVMVMLPQIRSTLAQGIPLLGAVGWMLGVGQPRHFLVQTLDRAELRPSGGFTGNYGVLTLQNGKLDPFTLYNVNDIDYGLRTNGWIFGRRPPAQYSWWPFANWGLRDSNLSADFPTSAQLIEQVFKNEGGGDVDGVIQVSPTAIAHVLLVTGPIYVPTFNDTVTAANLEDKIHFYEEDPRGIAIQQRLFPNDHTHSLRKRFTQMVVQLLQDKVKHLPTSQMLPLAKQLLQDLQAKDIQVYVNNTQIEDLLGQLRATGGIDETAGVDGYYLTQANTSVAKLTPYVHMTQSDNVTLDDSGGATHHLVLTWYNNPTGPIYGFSTYRDYVRIYVPPQAQLKRANGFDTGAPLCWAPGPGGGARPARFAGVPDCGANPYPSRSLVCPRGAYGPGPMAYTVFGGDPNVPWVLDRTGGPTSTATDVPGRQMWGGYVVVPRYCTATMTLDYYVPNVAAPSNAVPAAAAPYTMLVQRQGGTSYAVNITINPSPSMAASHLQATQYSTTIGDNIAFTLGNPNPEPAAQLLGMGALASLLGLDKGS